MSTQVGQQLREEREKRSLTLDQVSQATHMRVHYLQAIEAGDFNALPSEAQTRGFIRAYASYLDLDDIELLSTLDRDTTSSLQSPPPEPAPPSHHSPPEAREADAAFIEIGEILRQQRDLLSLSLDDVEHHTHLRQHYLQALEAGNLEGLPSPVQGRGMLNNYAVFLGLDPEPLLLRFADGLQARLIARKATTYQEARPSQAQPKLRLPASLRWLFSGDILIGGALATFLILFTLWGSIRIFAMRTDQTPTPTAPSIADVLLASPTATATPTPLPATPTNPPPPLLFPTQVVATDALTGDPFLVDSQNSVQVYVTVRQRTWMRITVDGETELDGRVIPGGAYAFTGESQVEIITGNGAALHVFFNQQDLGPMGNYGQVIHRIYTLLGVMTPTPTITPTATSTLPATRTPPATSTPGPGEVTVPALP